MKYISILIITLLIISFGCEDPIEVELNDAEATLVVDAWINNVERTQVIKLSQSLPYFENLNSPAITDATVNVTNTSQGTNLIFEHQGNGEYTWTPSADNLIGTVGDNFDLNIEWNGSTYAATTELNRAPEIDSIFVELRTGEAFTDDGYYAQFIARDPLGQGDAYWIKTYKNDTLLSKPTELNIAYDAGFDAGSRIDGVVFIFPIREFTNALDENGAPLPYLPGDKVFVEIHSISTEAFQFMEIARDQLNNSQNGIFALPVTNTRTNISKEGSGPDVLGFFNVAKISSAGKVIEE